MNKTVLNYEDLIPALKEAVEIWASSLIGY